MSDKQFSHTVMPREDTQQQSALGGPGLQMPKNPEEISALNERSTVDAKQLNEQIKQKEAEKLAASKKNQ